MKVKKILKKIIPDRILRWRSNRKQKKRVLRTERRMREVVQAEQSYGLNTAQRREKIIVSLTSYPARFDGLHYTIRSILAQTVKADRIILYLDEDVKPEQVPQSLLELKQRGGIEIVTRPLHLKPHKKYFYAIKENPDDIVITVDDDQIYPDNLLEKLIACHEKFPGCVIAARAHEISFNADGGMKKYNLWNMESQKTNRPSLRLCATGVGGVLYPPHCMYRDLLNYDLISKLSPNADDLWLKVMQVLQGTKVVLCDKKLWKNTFEVLNSQQTALNYENVGNQQNDIQMKNLTDYYHLDKTSFL